MEAPVNESAQGVPLKKVKLSIFDNKWFVL